ncbi:MAG TPA: hypothetical protein DCS21_05030 [Gammaproteobacteria bacterium]|nr:hypothetical protein [Gammaproteobacteria bacterium]
MRPCFAQADQAAKVMLVASVFSIPMPTAWASIFIPAGLICWLAAGEYGERWRLIRHHPGAMAALLLFSLYGLGTLYSVASFEETLAGWMKYSKLLLIPVAISLLSDETWRNRAREAFFWAMLVVLAVCYLRWLGLIPHEDTAKGYYAFKGRIADSIFMAYFTYLALQRSLSDPPQRWLWRIVALLAAACVLFLINGRTGQLLLPCLMLLLVWTHRRATRDVVVGVVIVLATAFILQLADDHLPQARIFQIAQEIQTHQPQGAESQWTSSGLRLEFYRNTLALIREHPWLGWGTGSFPSVYAKYAQQLGFALTQLSQPHNEYLLTVQQLGLAGLAVLMLMGWRHWQAARGLTLIDGSSLRALILTIGIGGLLNSLLFDSGEGRFYCLLAGVYLSGWRPESVPDSAGR